jgi:hypothetical protein
MLQKQTDVNICLSVEHNFNKMKWPKRRKNDKKIQIVTIDIDTIVDHCLFENEYQQYGF